MESDIGNLYGERVSMQVMSEVEDGPWTSIHFWRMDNLQDRTIFSFDLGEPVFVRHGRKILKPGIWWIQELKDPSKVGEGCIRIGNTRTGSGMFITVDRLVRLNAMERLAAEYATD